MPSTPDPFTPVAHLQLVHLADLIADAAERVHKKTEKAIESAMKRATGWDAWAPVFSREMERYVAAVLNPTFSTYSKALREECGRHGHEMRENDTPSELLYHLNALAVGDTDTAPLPTSPRHHALGDFHDRHHQVTLPVSVVFVAIAIINANLPAVACRGRTMARQRQAVAGNAHEGQAGKSLAGDRRR